MSRFLKSSNPVLSEKALDSAILKDRNSGAISMNDTMTVEGAVNKTFMLFAMMMVTSYISFMNPSTLNLMVGAIGGLIAVLVASFKPTTAPIAAPIYALLEGLFVGSITAMFAAQSGGIVVQAVLLTFGTLVMMLAIHKSGVIPVTQKFRRGVFMATGAIALAYVASFILGFFGINMPYLHSGGIIGIGISVVIIGVAALNLLLDFDSFEKGEEQNAPKHIEWLVAMGLLVTLVWLYIEFLRLLSKLQSD